MKKITLTIVFSLILVLGMSGCVKKNNSNEQIEVKPPELVDKKALPDLIASREIPEYIYFESSTDQESFGIIEETKTWLHDGMLYREITQEGRTDYQFGDPNGLLYVYSEGQDFVLQLDMNKEESTRTYNPILDHIHLPSDVAEINGALVHGGYPAYKIEHIVKFDDAGNQALVSTIAEAEYLMPLELTTYTEEGKKVIITYSNISFEPFEKDFTPPESKRLIDLNAFRDALLEADNPEELRFEDFAI